MLSRRLFSNYSNYYKLFQFNNRDYSTLPRIYDFQKEIKIEDPIFTICTKCGIKLSNRIKCPINTIEDFIITGYRCKEFLKYEYLKYDINDLNKHERGGEFFPIPVDSPVTRTTNKYAIGGGTFPTLVDNPVTLTFTTNINDDDY